MTLRTSNDRRQLAVRSHSLCEPLEQRVFLHSGPLQVTNISADDRGEVTIILNQAIRSRDVSSSTVHMMLAGPDGVIGNSDDVRATYQLAYQSSTNRIIARANLKAGTTYRLKLVANRIFTADGDVQLDGEFTGTFPSGNNIQGGNFEIIARHDSSSRPVSRWSTGAGTFNVQLFRDRAPLTFNNFRNYMNLGNYDNSFFTRLIPDFIVQGGSLQISDKGQVVQGPLRNPVVNEFGVSNTRGTIAMAKQPGDPNSATNQFFFNLADNGSALDTQNGGFTVFGKVTNASGLAVLDTLENKQIQDLSPEIGPFPGTDVSTVPVNGLVDGPLLPTRDLVVIRRVSMLMKLTGLV